MKRNYLGALVSFAVCQFGLAAGNDSLPPPASDKIYTFQQIEQQKFDLSGKIVRIEIGSLLGDGKTHLPDGSLRYIAEDISKGTMPFGQVAFPPQGLRNGALPDDLKKSPTAFYFRVHLSPGPNAAALCIAVGRQVSVAKRQSDLFLVSFQRVRGRVKNSPGSPG
jgi:hypothetical protein